MEEKSRESQVRRARSIANRKFIHDALLRQCAACGQKEDDLHQMVIRPKDGSTHGLLSHNLLYLSKTNLAKVVEGFQLVCRNNHYGKSAKPKHGTHYIAVVKKCPCEECREFHANRLLERREDSRKGKGV